jgi:two-component system NtrC family sensor kinase
MRRRNKSSGKVKTQRRKTLTRRNASKIPLRRSLLTTGKETSVTRLTRELEAISEILHAIAGSSGDEQAVLDTVAKHAAIICEAKVVDIIIAEGNGLRVRASFGDLTRNPGELMPLDRTTVMGRSICDMQPVHVPDLQNASEDFALGREFAVKFGHRTTLGVPLVRKGRALGAILVRRAEVRPFDQKNINLLTTFAAQAVIAIENTRLVNELRQRTDDLSESLEQQTATSEVLRVISSSPTNVQPVFDAIAESAVRLCDGQFSFVLRFDGKIMDFASCCGLSAEGLDAFHSILPMPASEDTASGRAIVRRAVVEISDVGADPSYGVRGQGLAKAVTYRSVAAVPLLHEGNPIGAIAVARAHAGPFPQRQIVLLQAFADQAVIAIENVRLFDEVQARTLELAKSLETCVLRRTAWCRRRSSLYSAN